MTEWDVRVAKPRTAWSEWEGSGDFTLRAGLDANPLMADAETAARVAAAAERHAGGLANRQEVGLPLRVPANLIFCPSASNRRLQ